jgi:TonB family protein
LRALPQHFLAFLAWSVIFLCGCANRQPAVLQQPSGPPIQAHDSQTSEPVVMPPQSSPDRPAVIEILTPTNGTDFDPYLRTLVASVKSKWYSLMPADARMGARGVVIIRFGVRHDGTLNPGGPQIEQSSANRVLDDAALAGISSSAPFLPLPSQFKGPIIELRFGFYYNVPIRGASAPKVPN